MAFGCDASKLIPGDIVQVEKPLGPSGAPTYPHYFIVMNVPDPLHVGDQIRCLGITSRTPDEAFNPEQHLKMRWANRKGGDPSTGLDRPSIAKVTFRHTLTVKAGSGIALEVEARHARKFIKSDHFQTLTALANAYNVRIVLEDQRKRPDKSK